MNIEHVRASIRAMFAADHPWAAQVATYSKTPPYADYGQWDAILYTVTGDKSLATQAADQILASGAHVYTPKPTANSVRQQFFDQLTLTTLILDGIDDERRNKLQQMFEQTCRYCYAVGYPQYVGGMARTGDSDMITGYATGIWGTDLLWGTDWTAYQPTNPVASVDFAKAVAAMRDYRRMAKGGEGIEGSSYNLGTFANLFSAAHVGGAAFADLIPDIKDFANEVASYLMADLTPDWNSAYLWGDIDSHWGQLDRPRWLTLLYLLYGYTGRADVWGAAQQVGANVELKSWLYLGWRVIYAWRPAPEPPKPPAPPTWAERTDARLAALEVSVKRLQESLKGYQEPEIERAAAPASPYLFVSLGNGHARHKTDTDYCGVHVPGGVWRGDHSCEYLFDISAWHDGVWWLRRPFGYAGRAQTGYAANSILIGGLSSMFDSRLAFVTPTDTGFVVCAQTSGSRYKPGSWNAPKPFVNFCERWAEYSPGAITVRDTFDGVDPRKDGMNYGGYVAGRMDRNNLDFELSAGRLWQQVWQTPTEPKETQTGFTWSVPGSTIPVTLVAPTNCKREVIPAAKVLDPDSFGKGQLDGFQIRLSSMAEKIVLETAVRLGG